MRERRRSGKEVRESSPGVATVRLPYRRYGILAITLHRTPSKPTTVQAMAMIAATRDSPAIRPEAIGT